MLIFRRVADVGKDRLYPDDSSKVSERALNDFDTVSEKLVKSYGPPAHVYVSPYGVARESVKNIDNNLIIIDPEIGRLQMNEAVSLNPLTVNHNPVFDTSINDFKDRCTARFRRLIQNGSRKVIWVVTHADVIRHFSVTQKIDDVPRDITVGYVISSTCVLASRLSTMVAQQPEPVPVKKIKKVKKPQGCVRCNRVTCICDAISASLGNTCLRCGKIPCHCTPKGCSSCGQLQCICHTY